MSKSIKHEIILYEKKDGTCPILDFIKNTDPKIKAKILRNIEILSEHNVNLREPLTKYLDNGIFELRSQAGNNAARVLYFFFVGNKIILTNGFIKKTRKTPQKYIDTALDYKKDFIERSE